LKKNILISVGRGFGQVPLPDPGLDEAGTNDGSYIQQSKKEVIYR